jgi:hypothetical protein
LGELIEVSFPLEQGVNSSRMSIITSIMKWSPLPIIFSHDICSLS